MTVSGQQVTAAICMYLRAAGSSPPSPMGVVVDTLLRATMIQHSPDPDGLLGRIEPWPFSDLSDEEKLVLVQFYASPIITAAGVDRQTGLPKSKSRRAYDWEIAKRLGWSCERVRQLHGSARVKVRASLEAHEAADERAHRQKCE